MAFYTTLLISLLLLSVSIFSASSSSSPLFSTLVIPPTGSPLTEIHPMSTCRGGAVSRCNDDEKVAVGSGLEEAVRRGLAGNVRYISYEALKKDRVPCNRRGNSYYNCKRGKQANPYRRGCSIITHCQKIYD